MLLISFLGLGEAKRDLDGKPTGEYSYQPTTYRFNQDSQTDINNTCYVVRAITQGYIIEEKSTGLHKVNDVLLLATEQAEKAHLHKISAEFKTHQLPQPRVVRVPFGTNAEQQWEQFNTILENIPVGSDKKVVFDITHGFRSQPFFAAAVINYVRSTRNIAEIPDMRILYGEYNREKRVSDIWDMSTFINLLDWSSNLQSFIKTGHGAGLAQLARKENISIQKSAKGQRPVTLDKLASSIRAFSENISTVRVADIIIGAATKSGSAANVLACIDKSEKEVKQYLSPLYPVLMELKTKISEVPANNLFNPTGYKAMLALAKLYVDYERYPEAAIVLREGWVSLYAAKDRSVNELMSKAERSAAEERWYEAETEKENAEGCADLLGSVRNDIQHGGFRPNPNPADKLIKNLNELIDKFSKRLSENSQGNLHELLDIK
jgi:CRISPR-associated protein Csx16